MKILISLIFLLSLNSKVLAQNKTLIKNYIIITYERNYNKSIHENRLYSWIISEDSLNIMKTKLSPIYYSGYSKTILNECQNNHNIYLFDSYKNDSYDFNEENLIVQNHLKTIINKNRKKIIKVKKKWKNGVKEKIIIYATPIKGVLCNCLIDNDSANKIDYLGKVYFPIKNISYNYNYDLKNLDTFLLQKKMRLSNVSNVPWE